MMHIRTPSLNISDSRPDLMSGLIRAPDPPEVNLAIAEDVRGFLHSTCDAEELVGEDIRRYDELTAQAAIIEKERNALKASFKAKRQRLLDRASLDTTVSSLSSDKSIRTEFHDLDLCIRALWYPSINSGMSHFAQWLTPVLKKLKTLAGMHEDRWSLRLDLAFQLGIELIDLNIDREKSFRLLPESNMDELCDVVLDLGIRLWSVRDTMCTGDVTVEQRLFDACEMVKDRSRLWMWKSRQGTRFNRLDYFLQDVDAIQRIEESRRVLACKIPSELTNMILVSLGRRSVRLEAHPCILSKKYGDARLLNTPCAVCYDEIDISAMGMRSAEARVLMQTSNPCLAAKTVVVNL